MPPMIRPGSSAFLAVFALTGLARAHEVSNVQRASLGNFNAPLNADASRPSISADARFVAFESAATNVVPADTNDAVDVFVRDRLMNTIQRVSVATGGAQAPQGGSEAALSYDGRFVAFESHSTNFDPTDMAFDTDIFVRDRLLDVTTRISADALGNGNASAPTISSDGRYVAFVSVIPLDPADTNNKSDVYLFDMVANTRAGVSLAAAFGNQDSSAPSISGDGSRVAFV